MAQPLEAPMPPDLDLPDGYVVVWAAIDATSGADVAGVVVSGVSLFGRVIGLGASDTFALGAWFLVPGPEF